MIRKLFIIIITIIFATPALSEQILFDDFEYAVSQGSLGSGDADAFVNTGPWTAVKARNASGTNSYYTSTSGARGDIYTATSIPGFTGSFPGTDSNYVAVWFAEASLGQTDFYLRHGFDDTPQGTLPQDVWYQYWIYPQNYGSEAGAIPDTKWLYPCTAVGGTCSRSDLDYLVVMKSSTYYPNTLGGNAVSGGNTYGLFEGNYDENCSYSLGETNSQFKLGANLVDPSEFVLPENTWTLVKIHIDVSGSSGLVAAGQGVYEEWHMHQGESSFTKVAQWYGGVTANFTFDVIGQGYRWLKVGTTFNTSDAWVYVDDFTIAESESDLPTYGDSPATGSTAGANFSGVSWAD